MVCQELLMCAETYLGVDGDEVVTLAQGPDEGIEQPQTSKHNSKAGKQLSCNTEK